MSESGGAHVPRMADGFMHRGRQVTRLEAFVDAAFAFAVTLLVISIDAIPDSRAALVLALKAVPSFAACFAMIAMFWAAHARWSRRYGFDDGASTTLSLALVFVVLVYVYPLRLQFGVFFAWITGGWLPSPMRIESADDVGFMFLVYGLAFAMMSLCMLGLYAHAWRRRDAIGLDRGERARTLGELAIYVYFVVIATLSIAMALWAPRHAPQLIGVPGVLYALLGLTGVVENQAHRHALAREAAG
ncbi:MAG: TMEM175 family protein [Luteimonas sp.]|nr:TMEM175 family protein [Luteimonas sp.]